MLKPLEGIIKSAPTDGEILLEAAYVVAPHPSVVIVDYWLFKYEISLSLSLSLSLTLHIV